MSPFSHYGNLSAGKSFLEIDKNGKPADRRLRICVVALLWQMACVDGPMNQKEFAELVIEVDREFGLLEGESTELIEIVEFLEKETSHLGEFIAEVNSSFNEAQREHLYSLLVEVAEVDGMPQQSEVDFAVALRERLNLNQDAE